MRTESPRIPPSHGSSAVSSLPRAYLSFLVVLLLLAPSASAQLCAPRPGVAFPPGYEAQRAENPRSHRFERAWKPRVEASLAAETEAQEDLFVSADVMEGLRAFREKRRARFGHRTGDE